MVKLYAVPGTFNLQVAGYSIGGRAGITAHLVPLTVTSVGRRAAGIGRIVAQVTPSSVEYSSADIVAPPDIPNSAFTTKDLARGTIEIISDGRGTPDVDATTDADATLFPALFLDRRATV